MTPKIYSTHTVLPDEISVDACWKSLYKVGGIAAMIILVNIPIQCLVYFIAPPPDSVTGFFDLFQRSWLLGLMSLDLLYVVNNILMIPIYLALYLALKRTSESLSLLALAVGLVGLAAYFPSNTCFEMLTLSNQYAAAATDAQRAIDLSAGQAMLAIYAGTAFDVYYVLGAISMLIFAVIMFRSKIFSKATAYVTLIAGILMVVPSTAGTFGLYLSLFSLIPCAIFLILFIRRFFQIGFSH